MIPEYQLVELDDFLDGIATNDLIRDYENCLLYKMITDALSDIESSIAELRLVDVASDEWEAARELMMLTVRVRDRCRQYI